MFGVILPADEAPRVPSVVVSVEVHGEANVEEGEAVADQDVGPGLAADDAASHCSVRREMNNCHYTHFFQKSNLFSSLAALVCCCCCCLAFVVAVAAVFPAKAPCKMQRFLT